MSRYPDPPDCDAVLPIARARTDNRRALTEDAWRDLGRRLYGDDTMAWRFVCPVCGHIATPAEWKAAGAPETAIAFSCIGRWSGANREAFGKGDGPCNYAGGGLFRLNPWMVGEHSVFAFADEDPA